MLDLRGAERGWPQAWRQTLRYSSKKKGRGRELRQRPPWTTLPSRPRGLAPGNIHLGGRLSQFDGTIKIFYDIKVYRPIFMTKICETGTIKCRDFIKHVHRAKYEIILKIVIKRSNIFELVFNITSEKGDL